MIGFRSLAGIAAIAAALCLLLGGQLLAEEVKPEADAEPKADVVGKASSPSRKSPIKVNVVEYKRAEDGPGTLTLAGTGLSGHDVHIFVNDRPFALVKVPEGETEWSTNDQIHLDEKVHVVRVQQFDEKTQMPAATQMFRLKLTAPTPKDLDQPPPVR